MKKDCTEITPQPGRLLAADPLPRCRQPSGHLFFEDQLLLSRSARRGPPQPHLSLEAHARWHRYYREIPPGFVVKQQSERIFVVLEKLESPRTGLLVVNGNRQNCNLSRELLAELTRMLQRFEARAAPTRPELDDNQFAAV